MVKFLFFAAVALSLLSQLPMILESGLDTYLKLSWLPLTLIFILAYPLDFINKRIIFFWIFMICFGVYCSIAQGCTGFKYFATGNDYYNMAISFMISIDSYIFWKHYASFKVYKNLVMLFLCSCLILATVVYVFFLKNADITSTVYAFKAKNSMGQILFVGGLLACSIVKFTRNKRGKLLLSVCVLFLIFVIMQLRSRATILCMIFVIGYYLLKVVPKAQRAKLSLLLITFIGFILINPVTYELVVKNIIFANRNATSVSSLSSGRSELIIDAIGRIFEHPILGNGNAYLDCMPIAMLLQYGVIGCLIVFGFLSFIAIKLVKLRNNYPIGLLSFILYWSYLLNSLFEAYPPFGPGAKCFALWMLIGFAFASSKNRSLFAIN